MRALLVWLSLVVPASADDPYVRCDRNVTVDSLDDRGRQTLRERGVYYDESRRSVPGSRYHMHYVFFTLPSPPETVMAVYTQFKKHPEAFSGSVKRALVTSRQRSKLKVFIEERIPYPVPNPRIVLHALLSRVGQSGYRLEHMLDSYEDNSSHPNWYDSTMTVTPQADGGSVVAYCKYVVPSDKRMPGVANNLTRDRMLELPGQLREWLRRSKGAEIHQAKQELQCAFDPSKPDIAADGTP